MPVHESENTPPDSQLCPASRQPVQISDARANSTPVGNDTQLSLFPTSGAAEDDGVREGYPNSTPTGNSTPLGENPAEKI